jgi:hypothetical protein
VGVSGNLGEIRHFGISPGSLVWQTDNGGEFKGDFLSALLNNQRVRIGPPLTPTGVTSKTCTASKRSSSLIWNRSSAVLISRTYRLYFNLARTNSHKENLAQLLADQPAAPSLAP